MDDAVQIDEFPQYLINPEGRVWNSRTGKEVQPGMTKTGLVKINLYRDKVLYTRSLPLLVARAFLPNDRNPEVFNTPIHLDCNPHNNHVSNLAWRPRWFAVLYYKQQFFETHQKNMLCIKDLDTGEIVGGIADACRRYGVLSADIIDSEGYGQKIFPTQKRLAIY